MNEFENHLISAKKRKLAKNIASESAAEKAERDRKVARDAARASIRQQVLPKLEQAAAALKTHGHSGSVTTIDYEGPGWELAFLSKNGRPSRLLVYFHMRDQLLTYEKFVPNAEIGLSAYSYKSIITDAPGLNLSDVIKQFITAGLDS